jgi:hypothetical protein
MRKLLSLVAVLVGLGLVLFLCLRPGEPGATESTPEKTAAGTVLQPESPEDLGARGSADAGSTPLLAQAPTPGDGALEVEVVAGEQPVPGASVRLYWRGARDPSLDEVSWRLASTGTTDATGRVRLASRPGGYLVAVHARGRAALLRDVVRPYGEALTHLRLALEAGHALTGRTVLKGTNEPLPMVELVLTAHGSELESWQRAEAPAEERVYASSDERGNFRVDGLASGTYLLEAQAPGHARTEMHKVKVPAAGPLTVALQVAGVIEGFVEDARGRPAARAEVQVSGSTAQVVTTGEGGGFSVEVEAGIHTLSARRGDEAGSLDTPVIVSAGKTVRDVRVRLGPGAVMEGRVVAKASGAPVAGAHVDISPLGSNGDSGRAVTDDTGHFSVSGLAPGSYDVVVNAPGFTQLVRRGPTVVPGERFSLEFQLTGTGTVEGHVRDTDGQPVAGARVTGGTRWGGWMGSTPAETLTDAGGGYRLEGLATGRVYISARREGAALGTTQPVEVTEGGLARVDFTLEGTGTVEGVVRAVSGPLPSEPLSVTVFPQTQNGPGTASFHRTEVDAAGDFRLTLPAGSYRMHVFALERRTLSPQQPKLVQVEAGRTVRAELTWQEDSRDTNGVQGIVLEPDGTPSPRAYVSLTTASHSRTMRTVSDEEGRFTLSLPFQRGPPEASVTVSASNGGRSGEVVGVKPGEQGVVVKLRPAASLRGRVIRASGQPVKGFSLDVQPMSQGGGAPQGERQFQGDRFELRDVPAAPVAVVVWTEDGARGETQVTPTYGTPAEVLLTLKSTAGLRGRVVDEATREPIADAFIFIEGERASNEGSGPDGRFVLEGLAAGQHTLRVSAGPFRRAERPVTLEEGQVLDVGDISLAAPNTRAGTIGAFVNLNGEELVIFQVIPGSPAARAGLRVGDTLLAVDGAPVTSGLEANQRLTGAPGSPVVLKVRRAGTEQTVSVVRAP